MEIFSHKKPETQINNQITVFATILGVAWLGNNLRSNNIGVDILRITVRTVVNVSFFISRNFGNVLVHHIKMCKIA